MQTKGVEHEAFQPNEDNVSERPMHYVGLWREGYTQTPIVVSRSQVRQRLAALAQLIDIPTALCASSSGSIVRGPFTAPHLAELSDPPRLPRTFAEKRRSRSPSRRSSASPESTWRAKLRASEWPTPPPAATGRQKTSTSTSKTTPWHTVPPYSAPHSPSSAGNVRRSDLPSPTQTTTTTP